MTDNPQGEGRPEAVVITREQQGDLDHLLELAGCRLTTLEAQDMVMKAYRLGRLHERRPYDW